LVPFFTAGIIILQIAEKRNQNQGKAMDPRYDWRGGHFVVGIAIAFIAFIIFLLAQIF